jgi:uncharacterized protein YneF (UPF0154 family)
VPVLAALIVALGALVGVVIGALFAAERVTAQMEENRVLFEGQIEENRRISKEQLDAEAERLERQLLHDRMMRDREEARRLFDEVFETLAAATTGVTQALASVRVFYLVDERLNDYLEQATPDREERTAVAAALRMGEQNYRLQLRLGVGHEISKQYSEVRKKALEILRDAGLHKEEPITEEERRNLDGLVHEMRDAANGFMRMASAYLAS